MGEPFQHKITIDELLSSGIDKTKKIITINSSLYVDDAFDYLLELVDENEGIAFITDKKQIYTHGTWFGSDVWSDTLNNFSKFKLVSSNGIESTINASEVEDYFTIKGEDGIVLKTEKNPLTEKSTIHLKYDVNEAIDENKYVDLGDAGKISLTIEEDKIAIKKYSAGTVSLEQPLPLEYDTEDTEIDIYVNVSNREKFEFIEVFSDNGYNISYDEQHYIISVTIPTNTDTEIGINYLYDGKYASRTVTQHWGYGWCFGTTEINEFNFENQHKNIENEFTDKEIEINQRADLYGWFAYPKNVDLSFIDEDSSIAGGWKKYGTFEKYSLGIEYQVYRTSHEGLGRVKWMIEKKQRRLLNGSFYV